jgi:hypothetical protein
MSRLSLAGVFASGVVPLLAWSAYGRLSAGGAAQKHFGWYPTNEPGLAWALLFLFVSLWLVTRFLEAEDILGMTSAAVAAWSAAVLLLSNSFYDRNISLDRRQLQSTAILTSLALVVWAWQAIPSNAVRRILAGSLVVIGPVTLLFTLPQATHSEFVGYRAPRWQHSQLLAVARSRPAGTWVTSNAPDAIALQTPATVIALPPRRNLYTGELNKDYETEVRLMRCALPPHHAEFLFFFRPTRGSRRLPDPWTVAALGARVERTFTDGILYTIAPTDC